MNNLKEKIASDFYKSAKKPRVKTVGALIEMLSQLPKTLPIGNERGGAILNVYNVSSEKPFLEIEQDW